MSEEQDKPVPGAGNADQAEVAAYIFDMLSGLGAMARKADLVFLAYLLEMAASEAARVAERKPEPGTDSHG